MAWGSRAFFTIGALVIVGCILTAEKVVQRPAVKNRITVTYWEKWTGSEGEAMRKIVDDYNASQDRIYVKMLTISAVNDKTLLAANGGNPPDVAGLWGEQVAQFADAKAVLDLTDLASVFTKHVTGGPAPERYKQDADDVISILDLTDVAQQFTKNVSACP